MKETHRRAKRRMKRVAKQSKRKHRIAVDQNGPPCPRCHRPMQIREHDVIREKHLRQPYYFSRWYRCMNQNCKTTLVMDEQFKVFTDIGKQQLAEREQRITIVAADADIVMQVAREMESDIPPWE